MAQEFTGAVALITGAASGIGAATARMLAERGAARLILVDLDAAALAQFAASLPLEAVPVKGDVADEALWAGLDLGGLTHAVVNAGIGAGSPIIDADFDHWRRVMRVNLDGAFLTLQAAMRAMVAGGRGGSVVVTGSVAGLKAEPGIAAYGSSKAAVLHLARIAAKEGLEHRIRVNAIAPGGVETAIWDGVESFAEVARTEGREAAFAAISAFTAVGRFAQPPEIAEAILFLLSDVSAFTTGSTLVSDGGYAL